MSTPVCKVWDAEQGKYVGIPAIKGPKGDKGEKGDNNLTLVDTYADLPALDAAHPGFLYYCKADHNVYTLNAERNGWVVIP